MKSQMSESLAEFEMIIHGDVKGELYYNDLIKNYLYKWQYSPEKTKKMLYKFWIIPELGNTFRLIESFTFNSTDNVIDFLKKWYNENKKNIEILSIKEIKFNKIKFKINEYKSCWRTPKQLGKMIKNGFEVPNCIPDKNYNLKEGQIFIKKVRDLNYKYKKTFEWFQNIVIGGDDDYVEKLLKIIDKWKQSYENKINAAKSMLRESFYEKEILKSKQSLMHYKKKLLVEYEMNKKFIEQNYEGQTASYYLKRLNVWFDKMQTYLEEIESEIENGEIVQIEYEHFGYIDNLEESIQINEISPSKLKFAVQRLNRKESLFKKEFKNLTSSETYQTANGETKKQMIDSLTRRHIGERKGTNIFTEQNDHTQNIKKKVNKK